MKVVAATAVAIWAVLSSGCVAGSEVARVAPVPTDVAAALYGVEVPIVTVSDAAVEFLAVGAPSPSAVDMASDLIRSRSAAARKPLQRLRSFPPARGRRGHGRNCGSFSGAGRSVVGRHRASARRQVARGGVRSGSAGARSISARTPQGEDAWWQRGFAPLAVHGRNCADRRETEYADSG